MKRGARCPRCGCWWAYSLRPPGSVCGDNRGAGPCSGRLPIEPIPRERALVADAWFRDSLGECLDCGHFSNWHYGQHGARGLGLGPGSACQQDHEPCALGCREYKGKLRPANEPASVFALRWAAREVGGVMRALLVLLVVLLVDVAGAAPTPTPRFTLLDPTPSGAGISVVNCWTGECATPTPEPPCGDFSVQVKDPARCATIGKPAPCYARCGHLCFRKGRKQWELLGCERLGALLLPTPTPVPTATPRPTASPRPSPSPTRTPAPGPTMNACDRGEPGWCYYWKTGKCTKPCPEF